jgi:hypothetical protein
MCDCFEGDEDERTADVSVDFPALIERTRAVEACKAGDPVPEALWSVFFGLQSGSIPWSLHQRMLASREVALAFLKARADFHRSHAKQARIRCTVADSGRSA